MSTGANPQAIVGLLKQSFNSTSPISLHEPNFSGNEWNYVKECLDLGWVATAGNYVNQFEQSLAEFTQAKHVIATVNGTAALHTCLKLAGVDTQDEVLIPALSFVTTANAVTYCGAVPHFVDVDETTLGVDSRKLAKHMKQIAVLRDDICISSQTGRRISALVVGHAFGYTADLEPLLEICQRYQIPLIEDAGESLGSFYRDNHTGTIGLLGAISFNGDKIVTCGGGGAILTNDDTLAARAKHITTTAKIDHAWEYLHDQVGFNYCLPNINAALGLAQLERLSGILKQKRILAKRYQAMFSNISGVHIFQEPPHGQSNYWLNLLMLDTPNTNTRDELLSTGFSNNLMMRPAWRLLNRLPMYRHAPSMGLAISEKLEQQIISLPSSPQLLDLSQSANTNPLIDKKMLV